MARYALGTLTSTPVRRNSYSVTLQDPTDVFKFNLGSTKNLNLSLRNISFGGDADLRLYRDSNRNGVFDSQDALVASSLRFSNNDDSINVKTASGTYFAQVRRYAGSGVSRRVNYSLDLSATSPAPTTSPSNLLPKETQVGNLASDRTYSGSISNANTSDVYAFSLGLYEGTNISLFGLTSDADIRLIRDRNNNGKVDIGEEVRRSSRGGSLSDTILGVDTSGNYLLQVYQYRGNTNYQVSFDHYPTTFA